MNNYSKQESRKATSEMVNLDYPIPYLIAKIRPKNFQDIEGKAVSVGYVDKIMGRFISEFNDKFIPKLNHAFQTYIEELVDTQIKMRELEKVDHDYINDWE